jgi:hypothetical protein
MSPHAPELSVDLARVRALRVDVDLERGAARLETAVALVGVAAPVAGAALFTKLAALGKSVAFKAVGSLVLVGATAGVAVVVSPDEPARERNAAVPAAPPESRGEPAPARAGADAPSGVRAPEAPATVAAPSAAPEGSVPRPPRPESGRRPLASAWGAASASRSALTEELRAVASAKALLATSPEAALRQVETTSGDRLDQEREIVAIRALIALGRDAEARTRAERFVLRFPDSPFRPTALKLAR